MSERDDVMMAACSDARPRENRHRPPVLNQRPDNRPISIFVAVFEPEIMPRDNIFARHCEPK